MNEAVARTVFSMDPGMRRRVETLTIEVLRAQESA